VNSFSHRYVLLPNKNYELIEAHQFTFRQ
jgi:hypothetical protein